MMKKLLVIAVSCSLLAACSSGGKLRAGVQGSTSDIEVAQGRELPAPTVSDLFDKSRPYMIGPFDKLKIDVFGIEEMKEREIQTDASGRISFPLAGIIEASGKTPEEVAREIEARLRTSYIRNPQVTVNLQETVSQVMTVDGEVKEPGLYPVIGRMTLVRAVATAKGVTEFAKLDDVIIFRTVNGRKMAGIYNLKAIRQGYYADPDVYANDVIMVGNSEARRVFRDLLQAAPLLSTPLIILFQK